MARSPAHDQAMRVLADGKWHPYEWALYETAKGVPPQHAKDRAEYDRVVQYMRDNRVPKHMVPPRSKNTAIEQLIGFGSRSIARDVLRNASFEHARHKETGQRIIRILTPGLVTPPPQGYEFILYSERSSRAGKTKEQLRKEQSARTKKARETRLRNQGIDPSTHVTQQELKDRRRAELAAMTPEEKKKWHSELARKSHISRLRNMGIDPSTHKTNEQIRAERRAAFDAMTPDERRAYYRERSRKSAETKRRRQQKEK